MAYSMESINGCTKKITFNFENVDLTSQIELALKEKQKTANMKGFRKGKAPLTFVQQVYGAQVENDALYRFVSQEFYKAVKDEDLKAVGYPSFSETNFTDGKNVSFEATVEIFPEVKIQDYSKYSFTKEDDTVSETDFADLTKKYLEPKSEMVEVTDEKVKIDNGHFVVFDFEGEKADGTRPENMQAKEFVLEIGSNQFIPGFEEGMIGLKKGSKEAIELTFPADYHEEDLREAKVKFHVDVHELKEKKVPELTDELAKELGFESVDDFNTKNKERLVTQKKREVKTKLQEEILKKLVEDNSFDVPSTLTEQQKTSVRDDLSGNLKQQGFNESMITTYFEKWDADITARAEFQVRSGLILDNLAKSFSIEATEADLDVKIGEMASQSGMEMDQLAGYYKSNEQVKNNLMYAIREEKTFDKLLESVKLK